MPNNKSLPPLRSRGSLLKTFSATALACVLSLGANAQVRVYDASAGSSVPPTPGAGAEESIGGIRTETTANPATPSATKTTTTVKSITTTSGQGAAMGGVRVDAPVVTTPIQTPKSDIKVSGGKQGVSATYVGGTRSLYVPSRDAPSSTAPVSKNTPYQPDRVPLDYAGNPILTSAQTSSTAPKSLGHVFVFVNVSEFSPIVSKRLDQLSRVPGIKPVYYMDERRPQDYVSMLSTSFFEVAGRLTFRVDSGKSVAEAYGVTEGNTIVYRLPNGGVRRYKLISEISVFLDQLERVRTGQST